MRYILINNSEKLCLIKCSIFICFFIFFLTYFSLMGQTEKNKQNYQKFFKNYNHNSESQIKYNSEQSENYKKIIELYENQNYTHASIYISETFKCRRPKSLDEIKGYMVSSYINVGNYKKAAEEVLQRDNSRSEIDFQLVIDLMWCLRGNAIKESIPSTLEFVDYLKKRYNSKLLSYFWCFISRQIRSDIIEGKHSLKNQRNYIRKEDFLNIENLAKQHRDDNFIDFAYYFLGYYDRALRAKPNSLIKDILLYARGYHIIRNLLLEPNGFLYYSALLSKPQQTPENYALLEEAKNYLTQYLDRYANKPHGDDAAYWIAWIEANFEKYENCLQWLNRSEKVGNGDYCQNDVIDNLRYKIIKKLPLKVALKYVELNINTSDRIKTYIISRINLKQSIKFANLPKNKNIKNEILYLIAIEEFDKFNFDSAIRVINSVTEQSHFKQDFLDYYNGKIDEMNEQQKLIDKVRIVNTITEYEKVVSVLRRKYENGRLAIKIIDEAIDKFSNKNPIDYLLYLKVLAHKIYDQESMKEIVDFLYEKYPNSEYLDDALAELAHTQLMYFGNLKAVENTVSIIYKKFKDKNACDNALNWLAIAYQDPPQIEKAKVVNKLIVKEFPFSRFARKAKIRLKAYEEIKK